MEPKNFIMTSDLYVRLDYDDLKDRLKRKMNKDDNYFKGYLCKLPHFSTIQK